MKSKGLIIPLMSGAFMILLLGPLSGSARAEHVPGHPSVAQIKAAKEADHGYNAQTDRFENLVEAGVIDPTKVVRTAVQNASSIAALMLTTEAVVAEIPEKKKDAPPSPGMDDY